MSIKKEATNAIFTYSEVFYASGDCEHAVRVVVGREQLVVLIQDHDS